MILLPSARDHRWTAVTLRRIAELTEGLPEEGSNDLNNGSPLTQVNWSKCPLTTMSARSPESALVPPLPPFADPDTCTLVLSCSS
jgi:hypothetical protein